MAFLQEFDLELIHIAGKENTIADALSRYIDNDQKRRIGVEEKAICTILKYDDGLDTEVWKDIIQDAQTKENNRALCDEKPERFILRNGMVRRKHEENERIYVSESGAWNLIERIHMFLVHFGTDKVIDFAKRYFHIENMDRIVRDVVASCLVCMPTKYYTRPTQGPTYYELPDGPGKVVSIDMFGPLLRARFGYRYVMVLMDQFSKLVKFYPVTNQRVDTIIHVLEEKYFNEMGIPETILSDRGGQFTSEKWIEFGKKAGFTVRHTSPYNPQSNPVERVMR